MISRYTFLYTMKLTLGKNSSLYIRLGDEKVGLFSSGAGGLAQVEADARWEDDAIRVSAALHKLGLSRRRIFGGAGGEVA
ncbi:MAG: hypothetical protein QXX12_03515 [Nanopusillaceae archaeon]